MVPANSQFGGSFEARTRHSGVILDKSVRVRIKRKREVGREKESTREQLTVNVFIHHRCGADNGDQYDKLLDASAGAEIFEKKEKNQERWSEEIPSFLSFSTVS